MKNILITGAAGFIGTNLIAKLLKNENYFIVGIDNLNSYYDISIKKRNIKFNENERYVFFKIDVTNKNELEEIFKKYMFDAVIHLAAQAGVAYSIKNSQEVIDVNIKAFDTLINLCSKYNVKQLIFASSSSVLGDHDGNYRQKSPYAVTKATNELQAYMYSTLYPDMQITGLRLYTVYGNRMRPDLAISKFTKAILNDEEIEVYGDGTISRDFTYIDDVVEAFVQTLNFKNLSGCKIFDIGNGKSTTINELIEMIKEICGKPDYNKVIYKKGKSFDAKTTLADTNNAMEYFGFKCKVGLREGLERYIKKDNH